MTEEPSSRAEIEALRKDMEARFAAIEERLTKIYKILYVPPELAKQLLEQSAQLDRDRRGRLNDPSLRERLKELEEKYGGDVSR